MVKLPACTVPICGRSLWKPGYSVKSASSGLTHLVPALTDDNETSLANFAANITVS